jgi:hypothetical protein
VLNRADPITSKRPQGIRAAEATRREVRSRIG